MKNTYLLIGSLLALSACPAGTLPGGSSTNSDSVNPNACGDLRSIDVGKKIYAFLDASVRLDREAMETEKQVRTACIDMAKVLGVPTPPNIRTEIVCTAVSEKLQADMKIGIAANANVDAVYEPAVCTVNADIAAEVAAECEARAQADIEVMCTGTCGGTCRGECDGTCRGSTDAGGACNGQCDGVCEGVCRGSCDGSAEVDAELTCKANAEVRANVEAQCTEPKVELNYDATVVIDASSVERVVRAVDVGLPRLISAHARLTGPVATAFASWTAASRDMATSVVDAADALGARSICVAGQISAAAKALINVRASISISVEASVSVSGAAGASL